MRLVVALASASAVALAASSASAITFDDVGEIAFDPKAVATVSFDAVAQQVGVTAGDGGALEGTGYVVIDTTPPPGSSATTKPIPAVFPVAVPDGKASYRARLFARTNRVVADVLVAYPSPALGPGVAARFFPTGRVTSDGWYEVETATFSVDGEAAPSVALSIVASGADVDAFELVPDGAYRGPVACGPPDDPACTKDELCSGGFCTKGDLLVPPLPPDDARAGVVDWLEDRVRFFFGGVATHQARLPIALATMEGMRAAPSAWTFWNGFATAIRRLHDWHTRTAGPASQLAGRGAFAVCVVEGDGDASHDLWPKDAAYPDVLVSHVGPDGNVGLHPGDRIVAVNGMHPLAFAESLEAVDWSYWRADDEHVHAEAAERLRLKVRRFATSITVIRCTPGTTTCAPPETIPIDSLPPDDPTLVYPTCDHRPGYHLATGNPDAVTHDVTEPAYGLLAASSSVEGVYGMIWNDAILDGSPNPYEPPFEEFRAKAKGLVLDHRMGNGGNLPGAEYLTTLFREQLSLPLAASSNFVATVGWFDAPFSADDGKAIFAAHAATGDAFVVGSASPETNLRTALLLARDGSASDWLAFGLQGSPNVRVFGRGTAGAFSSFFQFDYYGGLAFQFGSGDLFLPDGSSRIGRGVAPDEEIVPKQSDLLAGRDTAFERALGWVRTGQ